MNKKFFSFAGTMALLIADILVALFSLLDAEWEIYKVKGDSAKHFGDFLNLGMLTIEIQNDKITNVSVHDLQLKIEIIVAIILAVVAMSCSVATLVLSVYGYLSENAKIPAFMFITIFVAGCFKATTVFYVMARSWEHPADVQLMHFGRAFYIYSGSLTLSFAELDVHYHGNRM